MTPTNYIVLKQRYECHVLAGQGGQGEVWKGWDRKRERIVGIKMILMQGSDAENRELERLRREGKATRRVVHEAIARPYKLERDGDKWFLVREWVEGPTLAEVIKERKKQRAANKKPLCTMKEVRLLLDGLEGALSALRESMLIHRDLKPANIVLRNSKFSQPKLIDFGLAIDIDRIDNSKHITTPGHAVGTRPYMSPEQHLCKQLDHRVDVWAVATIAAEVLTGSRIFPSGPPTNPAVISMVPPTRRCSAVRGKPAASAGPLVTSHSSARGGRSSGDNANYHARYANAGRRARRTGKARAQADPHGVDARPNASSSVRELSACTPAVGVRVCSIGSHDPASAFLDQQPPEKRSSTTDAAGTSRHTVNIQRSDTTRTSVVPISPSKSPRVVVGRARRAVRAIPQASDVFLSAADQ